MALTLFNDPSFTELERAVNRAFAPFFAPSASGPVMPAVSASMHPMDVIERPDRYSIVADAPGMTPEDIHVELHEDTLVVRGEKKTESKQEKKQGEMRMHRQERTFTRFTRSFVLPEDANREKIGARMEHGVLTVDIPKVPAETKKAEVKRIKVAGGATTSNGTHIEGSKATGANSAAAADGDNTGGSA